jgi:hypothetical protein
MTYSQQSFAPQRKTIGSRALFVLLLLATLAFGVWVSPYLKKYWRIQAASPPTSTDYSVMLPEGETIITIIDTRLNPQLLARLVVERHGDTITGIPERTRKIAPRGRLSLEDANFFHHELGGLAAPGSSDWQRANRIRAWLASVVPRIGAPGLATRDPRQAYVQMRLGLPVLCGNLAQIYVALCEAAGLTARTVGMDMMARDGQLGRDAHAGAEIWIPEMGGWVYQDPTFNCYWDVDGKPASALQLHDALLERRVITIDPETRGTETASQNYVDPRQYFRQLSYEYRPGGDLLYYADGRLEPLNMGDRNWSQTDDRADIEGLDLDGVTVVERRGEVAEGIYVQVIGDRLFVRDRRDQERGIRVRSSRGAVQACAYEHRRAEDLGLFNNDNVVHNGSFRFRGVNEFIAQDWQVSGPVEAMTILGGQGMSALSGGKLCQRFQVSPGKHYLMYAKLNAVRGDVIWSLADLERNSESKGVVEPGGINEIVSDVVVSSGNELSVSFELPDGGAFRVMDVIVTQAPTLVADGGTHRSE